MEAVGRPLSPVSAADASEAAVQPDSGANDIFDSLAISSTAVLEQLTSRQQCPTCQKSVMYFCYYCHRVVGYERKDIPTLHLPVKLDVVKHVKEKDGKSTAIHAKILAPDDVTIHAYPDNVPTYPDDGRTILLFPGEDARQLEELDPSSFDRLVVVDGTWNQAKAMVRYSPVLSRLPKVMIRSQQTRFWRFQNLDSQHLATIEAIYYFYRAYHEAFAKETYGGGYDDLLYFFRFFYERIQNEYRKSGKGFTKRYCGDYIKGR